MTARAAAIVDEGRWGDALPLSARLLRAVKGRGIRLALVIPLLLAAFALPPATHAQQGPDLGITSKYYIVVDADTGQVFAQRGADMKVPIASLTKIYTAIAAIELMSPDAKMTTDKSDLFDSNSTTMGFGPGETFSFQDLLYGMLLPSGNDAAHAIARNVGLKLQPHDTDDQAVKYFVDLLNQRNKDMGLTETHLVNPHGLGVPGHYSSAHDLATFMLYALKFPRFVKAISTSEYVTADGEYDVHTTNKMLGNYDGLIGGKTGYDDTAGYCLIEVAQRHGTTIVSVTLNDQPDPYYQDAATLLDYGFQQEAARVAAGKPVSGEVLSYRDPNAAVILRGAVAGGSLGRAADTIVAQNPKPAAEQHTAAEPAKPATLGHDVAASDRSSPIEELRQRLDWHFLAVVLVVVLIILAGTAGSIRRRAERGSLRRPPTDPGSAQSG